ncbi:MAG TPA: winged helix-turn-helix domain-containing protein [Acidimicrobiales bacterium]|nr:winged helix-turn-helix domain-containing protein [Acidimicrobiales bacterium]
MNDPAPARAGPQLVVDGGRGRAWRDLGPVAWAVLCDLAASAVPGPDGWVAPVGVREIASSAGVNKDTAARALAVLAGAGLVERERAHDSGRRSVYRLHLPAGLELCPTVPDATGPDERPADMPGGSDGGVRPTASEIETPVDCDGGNASSRQDRAAGRRARSAAPAGPAPSGVVENEGDDSAPDLSGAAEPLNGRQGPAGGVQRRRSHERVLGPQDGSQGRLFDISGAVTAGSEDRAR